MKSNLTHVYLTLSQTTKFRLSQTERVCRRQFLNLMKMAESSPNRWKTLWEKEKLLVTGNFSFSRSVFKRPVLQAHKNQGLFGKGLKTRKFLMAILHWKQGLLCDKIKFHHINTNIVVRDTKSHGTRIKVLTVLHSS